MRRFFAGTLMLLVLLYFGGFIVFVTMLDRQPPSDPPAADAIVALTGGEGRIAEAYKLLEDARGKRLLITGVHPEVKGNALRQLLPSNASKFECCVDIGRQAENTVGNASETAEWVARHNYRSIILVTSTYHMPRARLELSRAMPHVDIDPYPVVQNTLHLDGWWDFPGTSRLLFSEYSKYMLTLVHGRSLGRTPAKT